ncbi:ASCH domain-containing protein [Arthrobacter sp. NPDC056691]|uniref:ASCH domain-containing protein n=1 Tax=unclassified Arthrobacter TaxID=235627 RepID=UPI003670A1FA
MSAEALPGVDTAAAKLFWSEYAAACPEAVRLCGDYTVERFGDSVALADELLRAVTEGAKRATSELADEFLAAGESLPRIGSHWIACDGSGVPRVVLRTVELRLGPFTSADEAFARDEGEDDGSLTSWQAGHRRYWTRARDRRGLEWAEADEIVFERFRVVWPPDLADPA